VEQPPSAALQLRHKNIVNNNLLTPKDENPPEFGRGGSRIAPTNGGFFALICTVRLCFVNQRSDNTVEFIFFRSYEYNHLVLFITIWMLYSSIGVENQSFLDKNTVFLELVYRLDFSSTFMA
jgi:hypothetical protein